MGVAKVWVAELGVAKKRWQKRGDKKEVVRVIEVGLAKVGVAEVEMTEVGVVRVGVAKCRWER